MADVKALGYLGFGVSDLAAWQAYATEFLGLQAVDRDDGAIDLRMDDYATRVRLIPDGPDDIVYAGWEVADAQALDAIKQRIEAAGTEVVAGTDEEAANRYVQALIKFEDPNGVATEIYYGPRLRTEDPFVSPLGVRFKTGDQGLGHVVYNCKDWKATERWYVDVLGMKLSDYIYQAMPSGETVNFAFLRCNGRHHSAAFFSLPMPIRLQHFMLEVESIDDVGRAMYRAEDRQIHTMLTLGRHSNDEMLSAYYVTPSGFAVEYGWGGLEVDDPTWHVVTHDVGSAWGHRFQPPPIPSAAEG